MDSSPASRRPRATAARVRTVLVAAALGGIAVASQSPGARGDGISALFPFGTATVAKREQSPAEIVFAAAQPGTCLTWDVQVPAPAVDLAAVEGLRTVDCAQEHRLEVTERVELPGDGGTVPTTTLVNRLCPSAARNYTAGRWDPDGLYDIDAMPASRLGLEEGKREALCGLTRRELNGNHVASAGKFDANAQQPSWPTGTCLSADWAATNCAGPHVYEVAGTADLTPTGTAWPPVRAQNEACVAPARAHLGGSEGLYRSTLSVASRPLSEASWGAGTRTVTCVLVSFAPDGRPRTLAGAAAGDFTIDGEPVKRPPAGGRPGTVPNLPSVPGDGSTPPLLPGLPGLPR